MMGGVGPRECGGPRVSGIRIQNSRAGGTCPEVRDLPEIKDLLNGAAWGGRGEPHPSQSSTQEWPATHIGFRKWCSAVLIFNSTGSSLLVLSPHLRLAETPPASYSLALAGSADLGSGPALRYPGQVTFLRDAKFSHCDIETVPHTLSWESQVQE